MGASKIPCRLKTPNWDKISKILRETEFHQLEKRIAQESLNDQFYYKELQEYYNSKLSKIDKNLSAFKQEIDTLKQNRKEESNYYYREN